MSPDSYTPKFDWDDVLITPIVTSSITSRYTSIDLSYIPLFTAPMDTVVDAQNCDFFTKHRISVCLPRNAENQHFYVEDNEVFRSMSLAEFTDTYIERSVKPSYPICIDTANGHTAALVAALKRFREVHGSKPQVMVGNIANPKTLAVLDEAGADYCRVGIGNGSGCLTTQQSAIGYPMASLIHECYLKKKRKNLKIKIVADGGFRDYADIIKALALGADYVMLGGIFNKLLESCAPTYKANINHGSWKEAGDRIDQYAVENKELLKMGIPFFKKFRGMSTKEVQRDWGVEESKVRTSEGISKINEVVNTLDGWMENFDHYLRNAMSYCGASNLDEYIGRAEWTLITPSALNRFRK